MDTTLNVEPNEADPDVKVTDEQPKLAANAVERVFLQNTLLLDCKKTQRCQHLDAEIGSIVNSSRKIKFMAEFLFCGEIAGQGSRHTF